MLYLMLSNLPLAKERLREEISVIVRHQNDGRLAEASTTSNKGCFS